MKAAGDFRSAAAVARLASTLMSSAGAVGSAGTGDAGATSRCALSRPAGHPHPYFDFGTRRLAMSLPPRATFLAVPEGKPGNAFIQGDGSIRTKVGWWAPTGALRVTGRRLDRPARQLRADVGPLSFAAPGGEFYPSLLYFSSTGCWRLTATSGRARLVAVVRVVKA